MWSKTGHFNSVLNSELLDTDPKQWVFAKKLVPSMILADSEKFFEPHYILKNLNFYTKKITEIYQDWEKHKEKKTINNSELWSKTGHFNSVLNSELLDTDPKQLVSAKKLVASMVLADSEKFFEPHYILKNLNFYTKK